MYRDAARGKPSHGHRQHAQKFGEVWPSTFQSYASGQTDRQTDKQTNNETDILITIFRTPLDRKVIKNRLEQFIARREISANK